MFDGINGWKVRPFLNRNEVEPFTAEELKTASMQTELDGSLVDYAAKGTQVELAGVEKVEGGDTYELKLTLKNGRAIHVWIDETFLETKMEGTPRRLDGTDHPAELYFHDYRPVSGVQISLFSRPMLSQRETGGAHTVLPQGGSLLGVARAG